MSTEFNWLACVAHLLRVAGGIKSRHNKRSPLRRHFLRSEYLEDRSLLSAAAAVLELSSAQPEISIRGPQDGNPAELALAEGDPALQFGLVQRAGAEFTDLGTAVTTDDVGNVYFSGIVEGALFIAKYTSAGNEVWTRIYDGWFGTEGTDIAVDSSGNVYWTGSFRGTVDFDPGAGVFNLSSPTHHSAYIQKLNINGNMEWTASYSGDGDINITGIVLDDGDNLYTTGDFTGTIDFNPGSGSDTLISVGGKDVFVAKLTADGHFGWRARTGTAGIDVGAGIAIDSGNNLYVTGNFTGDSDFDPGIGNWIVSAAGSDDAFLWKLTSGGSLVWANAIGGVATEAGTGICIDSADQVYLTGYFWATADFDPGTGVCQLDNAGGSDVFALKFLANGSLLWGERFGGTQSETGQRVEVDPVGNLFVMGRFQGTGDFDPGSGEANLTSAGLTDIFVERLRGADGGFEWAGNMGGASQDQGVALALDGSGSVYTVGQFEGIADFDPGPGVHNLTSLGETDFFFSQLQYNLNAPSVTINRADSQADPTKEPPILYTVVFSEPVTGFATGDVSLSGTVAGVLTAEVTPIGIDGTTYYVAVTGMTSSGTIIATIEPGVAHNGAGQGNLPSTSTDNNVLFDSVAPTVGLTSPPAGGSISASVINGRHYIDVTFDDLGGSGLNTTTILDADPELTIDGVSVQGTPMLVSGTTYRYQFTGTLNEGPVTATFVAGSFADLALNANAAFQQDFTVVGLPQMSISDLVIPEGNTGSFDILFTITLSASSDTEVSVHYATSDVTATAGEDYLSRSGTVSFAPGQTTETIRVPVLADRVFELNESFLVTLSAATGASIADGSATGLIVDDDPAPAISIGDVMVKEKSKGIKNAVFKVALSLSGSQPITVAYSTADGTAVAGADFQTQSGVLTFAGKKKKLKIKVSVLADQIDESNETFQVILSNPSHAIISDDTGIATIVSSNRAARH